jgi:hypothetical protein
VAGSGMWCYRGSGCCEVWCGASLMLQVRSDGMVRLQLNGASGVSV